MVGWLICAKPKLLASTRTQISISKQPSGDQKLLYYVTESSLKEKVLITFFCFNSRGGKRCLQAETLKFIRPESRATKLTSAAVIITPGTLIPSVAEWKKPFNPFNTNWCYVSACAPGLLTHQQCDIQKQNCIWEKIKTQKNTSSTIQSGQINHYRQWELGPQQEETILKEGNFYSRVWDIIMQIQSKCWEKGLT